MGDAVARMLGSQGKEELFDFPAELSSIAPASRIQKGQLLGELTFITASKRRVETEKEALHRDGDKGQTLQVIKKFLDDACQRANDKFRRIQKRQQQGHETK